MLKVKTRSFHDMAGEAGQNRQGKIGKNIARVCEIKYNRLDNMG